MNDPVQAWIVAAIVAAGGLLMVALAKRWTGASLQEILFSWDPRQPKPLQQMRVSAQNPEHSDSEPTNGDPDAPGIWPLQKIEPPVAAAYYYSLVPKAEPVTQHAGYLIHRGSVRLIGSHKPFREKHAAPNRPASDLLEEMKHPTFGGRIPKLHDKDMSQAFHRGGGGQRRTLH